ncbi:MAG: hypothetical protein AAF658_09815, partial [Myxococcota bacterium]
DPLYADLATVLEKSPWEHNLYAYAGGNPASFIDPSGLGREEFEACLAGDCSGFTKGGINPDEVFAGVAESSQFAKTAAPVVAEIATLPFGASAGGKVVGAVKSSGVLAKIGGAAKGAWNWTKGLFRGKGGKAATREVAEESGGHAGAMLNYHLPGVSYGANATSKLRSHWRDIQRLAGKLGYELPKKFKTADKSIRSFIEEIVDKGTTVSGPYKPTGGGHMNALWTRHGDAIVIRSPQKQFLTILDAAGGGAAKNFPGGL